jgi:hypothetical protein
MKNVQKNGAKNLLAQKAFSMFRYTRSSRIPVRYGGKRAVRGATRPSTSPKVHVYSPAYREDEFEKSFR